MGFDYKDWISNKADEIAEERFGDEYYKLTEEQQMEVWQSAEEAYKDHYADLIDAAYERGREANLPLKSDGVDN